MHTFKIFRLKLQINHNEMLLENCQNSTIPLMILSVPNLQFRITLIGILFEKKTNL